MRRIYVLDQNVLQRPGLSEIIAGYPQAKFVFPDTALIEMTKGERWSHTLRLGFKVLRPIVNRCYLSMSVKNARDLELKDKKSIEGRLLTREHQELLRTAIVESQFIDDASSMRTLRERIESVRPEIRQNELNAVATREELIVRINELKSSLSKKEIQDCKHPDRGRFHRLLLAASIGDAIYKAHMHNLGVAHSVAKRLRREKCMTLRWTYMLAHHALQWLGDGGIESANDTTVVNDVLDQDYVLTASFFTDVLSFEADVRNAYVDLKFMLALPRIR